MKATLGDGSQLEVSVAGAGPAVLLPVGTAVAEGAAAEAVRAWGGDPDAGHVLAAALVEAGFRVVAADYEGHLARQPRAGTLTADAVAADLLAVADAAGAERFAYYGYSWLGLAGLQLAARTDRLSGLVVGGFPPLGGPYGEMLAVTHAAHAAAIAYRDNPPATPAAPVEPGDWDNAEMTQPPELTGQYVTLYESLRGYDERAALERITCPRLAFAGEEDTVSYGPRWGGVDVVIGPALREHEKELTALGWDVRLIPGAGHLAAMSSGAVLPILVPWLRTVRN